VSLPIQPVTVAVAVADANHIRRGGYEHLLQSEVGIKLLTNTTSSNEVHNDHPFVNRRLKPRAHVTASEDEVARIKLLNPHVLLVDLNLCTDEDYALQLSLRHECPRAKIVLLTDDSTHENQIIQGLKIGARGYLKYETVQLQLSKAIQVVGRGEAWVPRKMLGNIMDHILNKQEVKRGWKEPG